MNYDLYRMADEHVVEEYEKQKGLLMVIESGMTLAAEVLRCTVAGEPLPELHRALPAADAPSVEWLDWAIVAGGLRLSGMRPVAAPQAERLFEAAA